MENDSGCLFNLLILTLLLSLAYSITGFSIMLNLIYLFGVIIIILAVLEFFRGL